MRFLRPQKFACCAAIIIAALGFSASSELNAATVVHWGAVDYVTSYQAFNTGTPSSGAGWATYNYSTTSPINPAGPTFYGAMSVVNGSGTGAADFAKSLNRFGIQNGAGTPATADTIRFGIESTSTSGAMVMRGLVFFQKANFLNGGSTGKVDFSSTGSLSLTIDNFLGNDQRARLAVYALVGETWGWYLSEASRTSAGTLSIADAGQAKWAPYVIDGTTSPLNLASTTFSVLGSSFKEIDAFGFYFNGSSTAAEGNRATFFVSSFDVNATVAIPEPGVALLSAGGIVLLAFRRFRKN